MREDADFVVNSILNKIVEMVEAKLEAKKALEEMAPDRSHYCGGHCDACRASERFQELRDEVKGLILDNLS